ncbi:MAG: cytochrome ubiquinol oxidase subunit I [Acidobacteriota bacterium]|jgi:cytochrome d ubiquinol oxidase subunit I|nr:cytochrome ubiquinol oxidase subunit I [Acidobacteriota bacterium]
MDAVLLSRIQFAITVMFHYLFPPLTIGMGVFLVFLEARYLKTKDVQYERAAKFWTKVFALNFALGVVSGIVMEFQFGTNWAIYSRYVGDVFGSILASEAIFAFFLESGFLALLLFGWDKVSPKWHFFSTLMVSLGSIVSALWIIVAISWQQTPAGFVLRDFETPVGVVQRAELTSFWEVVFNPSAMDRLVHVLIGAFILGSFFIMSISAWYLLKNRHLEIARRSFVTALVVAAVASLAAVASGDSHARVVAEHQPAKLAAMEGVYKTGEGGTAFHVFGIPDSEAKEIRFGVEIPKLLSLLTHRDASKPVAGLDQFEPDVPPVALPFWGFHVMVWLGCYFIVLTLYALWRLWRKTLYEARWLLWVFVFSVPLPFVANQLGWVAAEVGRQPWIVYNLLRTSDAVSQNVTAAHVGGSIALFVLIYALLFSVWIFLLNDKIKKGPEEAKENVR